VYVVASQPGKRGYNPAPVHHEMAFGFMKLFPTTARASAATWRGVQWGAGTVTNILLGAAVRDAVAQGGTWVTFAAPVVQGDQGLVIQSDGQLTIVFSNATR
jgi:hypothetical protein